MDKRNPTCGCGDAGKCNEVELDCDPCCRCIPERLCAKLESYDCGCDSNTLLSVNADNEYVGTLTLKGESFEVRISLLHEEGECYWRVVIDEYYIDGRFLIGYDGGTCEEPDLSLTVPIYECPADLTIVRHEHKILEFDTDEDGCSHPYCGTCECVCEKLCFIFKPLNLEYDQYELGELVWDPGQRCWTGGSYTVCLEPDEYTGACLLKASRTGGEESSDVFTISLCTAINQEFQFYDGELWVVCKECMCHRWCCDGQLPPVLHVSVSNSCKSVDIEMKLEPHEWDDSRWIWSGTYEDEEVECLIDHHGNEYCTPLGYIGGTVICVNSGGCIDWQINLGAGWCSVNLWDLKIECDPIMYSTTTKLACECLDELSITVSE